MKHVRSSIRGVFFLENIGVPVSLLTEYNEPISNGSICVDTITGNLYSLKSNIWTLVGTGSGTSDMTYIRPNPTTISIGGLPSGTTPNYTTLQEVFDAMLYPFIAPSISLSSSSLHEKGLTINKTMNYSISLNSAIISTRNILLNNVQEAVINNNSGSYSSPTNLNWSNSPNTTLYYPHNFTFRTTYTNYSQQNSTISVEFAAPTYYGSLDISNVDETNIKTLTKTIRKKANDSNLSFSPTLQRFVYAYPSSYGNLTTIIDQNNFNVFNSFNKTVVSFTLADSTTEFYNVYTSNADTTQSGFKLTFNF
jgi:hypothetical protein